MKQEKDKIFKDKVFMDNVHGYIRVHPDIAHMIIDTDIFQRLRSIEQTGMRTLFPSARHDRFIHSLGTYYLGQKAFQSFRTNVERLSRECIEARNQHYNVFDNDERANKAYWDKCELLFLIACLLHDCGHAPFSHTLEFIYGYADSTGLFLEDKLKQLYSSSDFEADFISQGSLHEKMSAIIVGCEFSEHIKKIIGNRGLKVSEGGRDVEFVARMIIGCHYKTDDRCNRIKNCLISLLNSHSFDVDSLDYIVRDAKLSGINSMSVDIDRLLGSLTLIEITEFPRKTKFQDVHICANILQSSIDKSEGNNLSIDGQYKGAATIRSFNGSFNGNISIKGNGRFRKETSFESWEDNVLRVSGVSYTHTNKVPSTANMADFELFGVTKTESDLDMEGTNVDFGREFDGTVRLYADSIEISSAFIEGTVNGMFKGLLLGDYNKYGGELICELGYHKSSLSVIQNVLFARNYEYQWIYSHHKVTYYSNYLIIELLRVCIKYLLKRDGEDENNYNKVMANMISWRNMVKNDENAYEPYVFKGIPFLRPVDCDITTIFKKCRFLCLKDNDTTSECAKLLEEYYTRNYKKSLWKSFAEFNIFFSSFTSSEKNRLYNFLLANSSNEMADQFGYLNMDGMQKEFIKYGMQNVVWVKAGNENKLLDLDKTHISFKNSTFNLRTVMKDDSTKIESQSLFFYIYYEEIVDEETGEKTPLNIAGVKKLFQKKIKTYYPNSRKG